MPKFPFISHRGTTFKTSEFLVKIPVPGQTGPVNRSEPVTHVLLNLNLNSTGFRSNRSGKLLPESGGLTGPVGFVNPAYTTSSFGVYASCMTPEPLKCLLVHAPRMLPACMTPSLALQLACVCGRGPPSARSPYQRERIFSRGGMGAGYVYGQDYVKIREGQVQMEYF